MAKSLILICDDEEDIRDLLQFNLEREGYEVIACENGEQVFEKIKKNLPQLFILDGMLPGIDGNDVCYRLKNTPETANIPVVMLSARSDETDQVVGFKFGADDYVTKPFSIKILLAKVASMLKRSRKSSEIESNVLSRHGLVLNVDNFSATLQGEPLKLTAVEYKLLFLLMSKPGRVFSRERILEEVRGDDVIITGRTVDVHILAVRRKLGDAGEFIETVRGFGYKFRE